MSVQEPLAEKVRRIETSLQDIAQQIGDALVADPDPDPDHIDPLVVSMKITKLDLTVLLAGIQTHGPPTILHNPTAETRKEARDAMFLREAKLRLNMWPEMQSLIARQLSHQAHPLEDIASISAEAELLLETIHSALHNLANPKDQSADAAENNCFADIPLKPWPFDQLMRKAYRIWLAQRRERPARFIDVGCGGGTKMLLARPYFGAVHGLEYDAGFVQMARKTLRTLGHAEDQVRHADALRFEHYADYDVIYFYRPINDDALLAQMEERILDQAAPGTILIAPYSQFEEHGPFETCHKLFDHIFVAGLTDQAVAALHRAILATGTDVIPPQPKPTAALGYWTPILTALHANGFRRG